MPPEPSSSFYGRLVGLEDTGESFVHVLLVESLGSTPQDSGAKMLVTRSGLVSGTVGGGRVEAKAIDFALALLAEKEAKPRFITWTLKGDVGMTCGGSVKLYFEPHQGREAWPIVICGAGHVAQALIPILLPLPCVVTCLDSRQEWLDRLPRARNLRVIATDQPEDLLLTFAPDSFLILMTKGHVTDRPILQRALAEHHFPYIGVIGSDSKAAILRQEMIERGLSPQRAEQFHCPIGLDFGTNHPQEIALSIAAQLLTERDRRRAAAKPAAPEST